VPSEDDLAMFCERELRGEMLFNVDNGKWLEWRGHWWELPKTAPVNRIRHALKDYADDKSLSGSARRSILSLRSFENVLKLMAATQAFGRRASDFDIDPWALGTPDGVVDLRTGDLCIADPAMHISKCTAVSPADTADCPVWRRFLAEATRGNAELERFLGQIAGYCLTGNTSEHALFFAHGGGGNGKGVFVNTLVKVVGDYGCTAPMETFAAGGNDRHPTELAMLAGRRLVAASETEEGRRWAEAKIKSLTGGDPIAARFMRQDFFTFQPRFKLLLSGNTIPAIGHVDDALRRRFNLLPFVHRPEYPDPDLTERLVDEWPGILRWAIDGCLDWQRHGLVRPDQVLAATDAYFADQDLFGHWLAESCRLERGNDHLFETSARLFASWSQFATKAGEKPGTQKAFAPLLRARGCEGPIIKRIPDPVRCWLGIALSFGADLG